MKSPFSYGFPMVFPMVYQAGYPIPMRSPSAPPFLRSATRTQLSSVSRRAKFCAGLTDGPLFFGQNGGGSSRGFRENLGKIEAKYGKIWGKHGKTQEKTMGKHRKIRETERKCGKHRKTMEKSMGKLRCHMILPLRMLGFSMRFRWIIMGIFFSWDMCVCVLSSYSSPSR